MSEVAVAGAMKLF